MTFLLIHYVLLIARPIIKLIKNSDTKYKYGQSIKTNNTSKHAKKS